MNLDKFGQWVAIFANIGVLMGFLFVAYQLQLNTTALQTSSTHKTNELFAMLESSLMGDTAHEAFAQAMIDPYSITCTRPSVSARHPLPASASAMTNSIIASLNRMPRSS